MESSKKTQKQQKEEILKLLENKRYLERAIVVIFDRQTLDEKLSKETLHYNGIGFAGNDARRGSYLAKQILEYRAKGWEYGNILIGKGYWMAKSMMRRYWKQLANAKADFDKKKAAGQ